MRLDYAFLAYEVDVLSDGTVAAAGIGIQAIRPPAYPYTGEVAVVIAIVAHPDGEIDRLKVVGVGPEMEPVGAEVAITMAAEPGPLHPEGWELRTATTLGYEMTLGRPGSYSIELSLGGTTVSLPFVAKE